MIIGVVGFINSGKGTFGDILEERSFVKDSFARPLKDAAAAIFGWDRIMLEGATKESREWREQADPFWSEHFGYEFTPRLALQWLGTESCRDVFHQDIWVISLLHRNQHNKNVVITDVRFQNEIKLVQNAGGIIVRVKRGPEPEWYEIAQKANEGNIDALNIMQTKLIHKSEWDWIGSRMDYVIQNDGTLDEFKEETQRLLDRITTM